MTPAPARPALAALLAGTAHVARYHHGSTGHARDGWLALRVALNVARELDTLLEHAVAETAAMASVVLRTPRGRPARTSLGELRRASAPHAVGGDDLIAADRLRAELRRAISGRRQAGRYRIDPAYPVAIGATYGRIAAELARMTDAAASRPVAPPRVPPRTGGDDAPAPAR